jgi:ABC-type sugar transport system substrate-binding protein
VKKLAFLLFGVCLLLSIGLVSAQDDTFKIGALVKTLSNPFFVRMGEGYEFAAERYNLDIVIGSATGEGSADEQREILEGWLEEGDFDAFIVTPIGSTSLNAPLAEAAAQGIPVINIDELIPPEAIDADGLDIATKIASNNVRAGSEAAEFVLTQIDEGADVAVIEGAQVQSSFDRVNGFIDTAERNGLRVVASQPANWDTTEAYNVATALLEDQPTIQAIFAANDGMGLGAVQAVEEAGRAGEVIVVSVDAIPEALAAVEEGRLAATVAQFPEEMAVLAVEAMLKVLNGRPVAPEIESPVVVITADNLDLAQSQLGDPTIPDVRLGALMKTLANPYWLRMQAGYETAAEDAALDLVLGSVESEGAVDEQTAIFEEWLADGNFDGFIVSPIGPTSLNTALVHASEQNIPVINIDELIPADAIAADGLNIATQIASNNVRAGSEAAEFVLTQVEAGADVAVIEGAPGTQSSIDRVTGFIETAEAEGLRVVASQPGNWDPTEAYNVATAILADMPSVRAIFAANDGMGLAAVQAIEDAGRTGEVIVVSVDGVPEALDAVREGRLAATVAQYPDEMAYLAVENMIKVLEGRPVPPFVESPVQVISAENVPQ